MRRWWLVMALLLSVGVNLGIVASRLLPPRDAPPAAAAPPEAEVSETPDDPPPRDLPPTGAPPRDVPFRRTPPVIHRMADELALEGERRERFVALQQRFLQETVRARSEIQRSQFRLRHELTSAEPDRAGVAKALEQLTEARRLIERAFVDNVLDTRELLDPEQTRRFLRLIQRLRWSAEQFQQRRLQGQPGGRGGDRPPWQRPGPRFRPERPPDEEQGDH